MDEMNRVCGIRTTKVGSNNNQLGRLRGRWKGFKKENVTAKQQRETSKNSGRYEGLNVGWRGMKEDQRRTTHTASKSEPNLVNQLPTKRARFEESNGCTNVWNGGETAEIWELQAGIWCDSGWGAKIVSPNVKESSDSGDRGVNRKGESRKIRWRLNHEDPTRIGGDMGGSLLRGQIG